MSLKTIAKSRSSAGAGLAAMHRHGRAATRSGRHADADNENWDDAEVIVVTGTRFDNTDTVTIMDPNDTGWGPVIGNRNWPGPWTFTPKGGDDTPDTPPKQACDEMKAQAIAECDSAQSLDHKAYLATLVARQALLTGEFDLFDKYTRQADLLSSAASIMSDRAVADMEDYNDKGCGDGSMPTSCL